MMDLLRKFWSSLLVYEENPTIYVLSMHSMSVVSICLFTIGVYCVATKNKSISSFYRKLIIIYMAINITSQLSWCSLYLPHLILPYTAGNTLGVYRMMGIPPEIQLTASFSLLGVLGGITALMFAYRMYILLPTNHAFKQKKNYMMFIGTVIIGSMIIPPPLIAWCCYSSDHRAVKDRLVQKFGYITDQLYDNQTLAFEITWQSPLTFTTCYLALGIISMAAYIFYVMRKIHTLFNSFSTFSTATHKKQNKSLTKILFIQTNVTFGLVCLPFLCLSIFMLFGISACGIVNICFVLYGFADPCSTIIMILMHQPYKMAVKELLIRFGVIKQKTEIGSSVQAVSIVSTAGTNVVNPRRHLNNDESAILH